MVPCHTQAVERAVALTTSTVKRYGYHDNQLNSALLKAQERSEKAWEIRKGNT